MTVITLARKPLSGSVASTAVKYGTGGINIDGCRIGTSGATSRGSQAPYPKKPDGTEDRSGSWARTGHEILQVQAGRWPANLILDHLSSCRCLGSRQVYTGDHDRDKTGGLHWAGPGENRQSTRKDKWDCLGDGLGNEMVAVWGCAPGCPVSEMDKQADDMGIHSAGFSREANITSVYAATSYHAPITRQVNRFGDSGGASRFFYQVQSTGGDLE